MAYSRHCFRLGLWGNNGCEEYRAVEEILEKLNVPVMFLFYCSPKRRENWDIPEECVQEYSDVFFLNGQKQGKILSNQI